MELRRKPKLVAAFLIGGTLILLGGGAFAATLSAHRMTQMIGVGRAHHAAEPSRRGSASAAPPVSGAAARMAPVAASAPAAKTPPVGSAHPPVTYAVKGGDTLSGIAVWFRLHGYGDLYAANAAVIGANPNLIFPGEQITISGAGVIMAPPA